MKEQRSVRVLIVDDSATARVALREALRRDPMIEIVGEAANRDTALELVQKLRPDLVTMDLYLKGQNGLEITAEIMQAAPTPILVVTAVDPGDKTTIYEALRVGALEVCGKLPAPSHPGYEQKRRELSGIVRALARVPVVRRRRVSKRVASGTMSPTRRFQAPRMPRLVVIGASTGGPPVVGELLKALPASFGIPIVLVQHMAFGFTDGFAEWLGRLAARRVVVVRDRVALEPGVVYLGGEGRHIEVVSPSHLTPTDSPESSFHRPAVDVLFCSAARQMGSSVIAILLTGMGVDGVDGMRELFDAGAWTFAQSPASSAAESMPRNAIESGCVLTTLTPEELPAALMHLCGMDASL